MRKVKINTGEHYHIYNRGNQKQTIFFDTRDWVRFLFLIVHNQSPRAFYNLGRQVTHFVRHSVFNITGDDVEKIEKNRRVELVSFAIMPNHFHLLVKEISKNGVATYMQRIQNAYTKYFNTKYKKSGHLLQGPFRAVHVKTNNQLLHLSSYIHRNPKELFSGDNKNKEFEYMWSSYKDCSGSNRWRGLLRHQILTEQFDSPSQYKKFVEKSSTKLLKKELLID